MLKKWTANRIVKDWKKALAVLLWQSIILLSSAQSGQQLAEISVRDGLPTNSSRKLIELGTGSVAVATDAGLFFLPNNQSNLKRISKQIGIQRCADLYEEKGLLYVATYNDGLSIFELITGNLIIHYGKSELPKIRRFRKINQSLYAVARTGIWRITQSGIFNVFDAKLWMLPGNKPMDVFYYNQKLHVLSYPEHIIYEQQANYTWANLSNSLQKMGRKIDTFDFANLVSFVHDNKVFLGSVNYYMVMDSSYHFQKYELLPKHNESWAFWDFSEHNGTVYGAVTNTNDFEDGVLHIHDPKIHTYSPLHHNPIWSITPSRFKDAIWLSTENQGVLLLHQPKGFIPAEFGFERKFVTENFLVGLHDDNVKIQTQTGPQIWTSHLIHDRIRSVLEINNKLYLFGADYLWIYNPVNNKILQSIRSSGYQWMTSIGQAIYFFEPYGKICIFTPGKDKLPRKTKVDAISDAVVSQNNHIIFHKRGKGFGCIDSSEKYHAFNGNGIFDQYTSQFQVSGNQLLVQSGNALELYEINFNKYTLQFKGRVNLTFPFLNIQILKITASEIGFHLFTGDYIFTVNFFHNGKQIELLQQQYLGRWNTNLWLYTDGNQFAIDRGDAIQFINQSKKTYPEFRPFYGHDDISLFPLEGILNIRQNINFKLITVGSNYFDVHRSLYEVAIRNLGNGTTENLFFTGNQYRWINGIDWGRYQLTVSSQSSTSSSLVWSVLIFYQALPFWFIVLFFTVVLFIYFNSQLKMQGSLNRRISILQLKTLQNNFNPHFIYNCMSLIQSLIIGNEQKKALEVTAKLAKLNRVFLENLNNELISLHNEITFIKEYVEMERMRFESDTDFRFTIHIPKNFDIKSWQIPPMILQPLIENSIKHGVLSDVKTPQIDLYIHLKDTEILEIRIENTCPKARTKVNKGIGIGIKLVADRLSLLSELHPGLFRTTFTTGIENNNKYVARIAIERFMTPTESIEFMNQLKTQTLNKKKGGGKS